MYIAIFSDTHDELPYTKQAIRLAQDGGCALGFHLGDICTLPTLQELERSGMEWKCVWGNNDDALRASQNLKTLQNVDTVPTDFREIALEGRQLFLTHYPEIARMAALSARYDAVFHGHTHRANQEVLGHTLLANPGELCGRRYGNPSFAIYDTEKNTLEHVYLLAK